MNRYDPKKHVTARELRERRWEVDASVPDDAYIDRSQEPYDPNDYTDQRNPNSPNYRGY